MAKSFFDMPDNLQIEVLSKLDYVDLSCFRRCSQSAFSISRSISQKLPQMIRSWTVYSKNDHIVLFDGKKRKIRLHKLLSEPVRLLAESLWIENTLDDDLCSRLIRIFETTGSITKKLQIFSEPPAASLICQPLLFNRLIQVSQTRAFADGDMTRCNPEYFRQTAVRNLSKLEICSKITDADLLEMKAYFLVLEDTAVTTKGINKLLKEWFSGSRSIENMKIVNLSVFFSEDDADLLEGLPFSLLWKRETHENSRVSHLPLTKIHTKNGLRIYGISNENKGNLYVKVVERTVKILRVSDFEENLIHEMEEVYSCSDSE